MTRLVHLAVALLLLPLAAACGGDDEYQPPPGGGPVIVDKDEQRRKREARVKEAAGKLLEEGDGYWFIRPKTWRDRTRPFQDIIPFLDTAITEKEVALYADLMYVTVLPGGPYLHEPLEDQTADFGRYLRGLATGVEAHRLTTVDRKEAVHHSGLSRGGAFEAQLDQYVVLSEDHLYTITFKLDIDRPKRDRAQLIERILDTWHWDA